MEPGSLRAFRRLEKDMLRTEKAYVQVLMKAMDEKEAADLRALEKRQSEFEAAIREFKAALYE
ncbi:MAG: hypothetical protein KH322_04925 [Peptoniphilaceae bacterium]|uniref:hypothetical protein n=1 Tax=Aedoeadaptatus acetigenes TaxID=2981723 RepID=UPI0011DCAE05|nr:hypothetical protein [Aedoeadaptatus acetigenes]MBS6525341.1 hypothetical protein [Peptoniphilaceae bacterium]MCU6785931.1 hypothetical protein [Aedoeadaptatus acetigenes]